jgi:hypothetical protein
LNSHLYKGVGALAELFFLCSHGLRVNEKIIMT